MKKLPSLTESSKERTTGTLRKSRLWWLFTLSTRPVHGKGTLKERKERNRLKRTKRGEEGREHWKQVSREKRGAENFFVAFWVQKRELEAESEIFAEIEKLFYSFSGKDHGNFKESQCMNQY